MYRGIQDRGSSGGSTLRSGTRQSAGVRHATGLRFDRGFRSLHRTDRRSSVPGLPARPNPAPVVRSGSGSLPCAVERGRGPLYRRFASPMPFAAHAALGARVPTSLLGRAGTRGRAEGRGVEPDGLEPRWTRSPHAEPKTRDRTPKYAFGRDIYTMIYTRSDLRRDVKT